MKEVVVVQEGDLDVMVEVVIGMMELEVVETVEVEWEQNGMEGGVGD